MLKVGLTGGIGSGKSTVSALLSSHGAVIIDYDELARAVVVQGSPVLEAIGRRFPGVIGPDGVLDRPALGAVVFSDTAARADLEAITHPAIRELAMTREAAVGRDAVVVHDNPLLVEMGADAHCDVVIVVDVPPEVQVERLVRTRGMSEGDAQVRISAQTSREARTGAADLLIDNTGPLDELATIVGGVWSELVSRAAAHGGESLRSSE